MKGKLYRVFEPHTNDTLEFIRIINEENEDYPYPRGGWLGLTFGEAPACNAKREASSQPAGASQSLCPSHPPSASC